MQGERCVHRMKQYDAILSTRPWVSHNSHFLNRNLQVFKKILWGKKFIQNIFNNCLYIVSNHQKTGSFDKNVLIYLDLEKFQFSLYLQAFINMYRSSMDLRKFGIFGTWKNFTDRVKDIRNTFCRKSVNSKKGLFHFM